MTRIDGSKRSSELPLRRLRPAWAASAAALCGASRRERHPDSQTELRPPLGCCVDNSRARRRMLSRAARRLCRSNAVVTPRTLMQKLMTVRHQIAPYTAAAPQGRYVNNSSNAPRRAGCRARCPGPARIASRESAGGVAYARLRRAPNTMSITIKKNSSPPTPPVVR